MSAIGADQAAGLRHLLAPRRRPVVCMLAADEDASAGRFVGDLAQEIVARGRSVRLIDCVCEQDLIDPASLAGSPNPDAATRALRVVAAQHLGLTFGAAEPGEGAGLARALSALRGGADCGLVYAPAASVAFSVAADEVLLVCGSDPAALLNGYRSLKRMSQVRKRERVHVVMTGASSAGLAQRIFGNLYDAAGQFLDLPLEYWGALPASGRASAALRAGAQAILRSS